MILVHRQKMDTDYLANKIFQREIDMEGSHISIRSGGWKQSVIKKNPTDSRIFGQDRDLPVKFSPAKYPEPSGNTSKQLVKSKIMSYSQDEIVVGADQQRSRSKDRRLQKRPMVQTPRSKIEGTHQIKLVNLQRNPSDRTLDLLASPLRKGSISRPSNTMDFVHEIKLQYMRFKEKILGELKKLQEDIKRTIHEVMAAVPRAGPQMNMNTQAKMPRYSSLEGKSPSFGVLEEPFKIANNLPKPVFPESVSFDANRYRDLLGAEDTIESVLPKIKERMSKFFDIMSQLKSQINDQAMYSPIHFKDQEDSPQRMAY